MRAYFAAQLACGVQKDEGAYLGYSTRLLSSVEPSEWPGVAQEESKRDRIKPCITSPEGPGRFPFTTNQGKVQWTIESKV